MRIRGFILYEGPSMLDEAPIVAIATASRNRKTGAMVQTWVLRSDMHPVVASRAGQDQSICGSCRHMGVHDDAGHRVPGTRTCYVMLTVPGSVWRKYRRGTYARPSADQIASLAADLPVRLGSYGDPAAVPFQVWANLTSKSLAHTGYTHQWQRFPEFNTLCMASCDSVAERTYAKVLGFRTFRVASKGDMRRAKANKATGDHGEVLCPASEEAGKVTTCIQCKACGGTSARAKADVMIPAHGSAAGRIGNAIHTA